MEREDLEKRASEGIQEWIKDKKEDRLGGKDLFGKTPFNPNPKKKEIQRPTTVNGVLTGKTI